MSDYPSIERRIEQVKAAPHGQKSARQRRLVRDRLASLKREIKRYGLASPRSVYSRAN